MKWKFNEFCLEYTAVVEGLDLIKEIMILNRVSGSVWKSVIRLRGLDEKDRDVES